MARRAFVYDCMESTRILQKMYASFKLNLKISFGSGNDDGDSVSQSIYVLELCAVLPQVSVNLLADGIVDAIGHARFILFYGAQRKIMTEWNASMSSDAS